VIDWCELTVTVGDRSAIYLETFHRQLDRAVSSTLLMNGRIESPDDGILCSFQSMIPRGA